MKNRKVSRKRYHLQRVYPVFHLSPVYNLFEKGLTFQKLIQRCLWGLLLILYVSFFHFLGVITVCRLTPASGPRGSDSIQKQTPVVDHSTTTAPPGASGTKIPNALRNFGNDSKFVSGDPVNSNNGLILPAFWPNELEVMIFLKGSFSGLP